MASGSSKPIKMERKPLMLKDYLLDDLSSCSSNGFKSFPRRQCCTTVRFLLEIDLNNQKQSTVKNHKLLLPRSRSRAAASTTISALQRASDAVLNAVKQLPFPSVKSPSVKNRRKGILPRSISKRFLKNRFWGKADNEVKDIKRLRLFGELLREQAQPSDRNTTVTTSTSSNSWCDSEFTSETLGSSGSENDVVYGEEKVDEKKVEIAVGDVMESETTTTASTFSSQNAKEWPNEEEKEQFSPVSVLDCPFEDEDETSATSSPFNRNLARLEGTKRKLLQKIRRFENLSKLEPVDLEKRIAMSELEEEVESIHNSVRFDAKRHDEEEEEGEGSKEKARELVKLVNNMANFHADNLLFDFFREAIMEEARANKVFKEKEGLEIAGNWVSGKPCEVFLGWEVKKGRKAYVRDMERGGRWNKFDEEKEEIGLDLEDEVWNILMKELLLDLVL